jgi:phage gpG-like protein
MAGVTCKVADQKVVQVIQGLANRLRNMKPALRIVGQILRTSVVRNFEEGGRPSRWKESKRASAEGGLTLSDTGRLRNSIHAKVFSNQVQVGTNVVYAAIQHFGGSTAPHTIFAKPGSALFWPGAKHPVKKVNHPGSKIPARPFMMIQTEDWDEVKSALNDYAMKG